MQKIYLSLIALLIGSTTITAQSEDQPLPRHMTEQERQMLRDYDFTSNVRGITTPPPFDSLRTMAEWEETQALMIGWEGYPGIQKQIVKAAKQECEVLILTDNQNSVENFLNSTQGGGPIDNMDNITFIDTPLNSVWIRDYGPHTVYGGEQDSLLLVDWIYNRPRPLDDASPEAVADQLGIDLYSTTEAPTDLVNTGGNFIPDGFGTAMSSELVLEENEEGNPYDVTAKDEEDIDNIHESFMGINRYIKFPTLPYDGIHHIDMHMKLLDENTLLVGEYPEGVADGPQINANIEYLLDNFNSVYDTPYEIVRIPMPDSPSGLYPDDNPPGYYRTYTNSIFVNNTLILPTYREEYDTTAIRILQEELPGYNIVPVDCDNPDEPIIAASGAIHCITKLVGAYGPLTIRHEPLADTENTTDPYMVDALISHRTGIDNATLYYTTDTTESYIGVAMSETNAEENTWTGMIPAQPADSEVFYYIHAEATNGKERNRPMPAPDGYWNFNVLGEISGAEELLLSNAFKNPFPNPANAITCIPIEPKTDIEGRLVLRDVAGKEIKVIHSGPIVAGDQRFFIDASQYAAGAYFITLESENARVTKKLMIR